MRVKEEEEGAERGKGEGWICTGCANTHTYTHTHTHTHTHSTLETDRDKDAEHKTQVRTLQDRVKQLETTARENISEKAKVFDKLSSERGRHMPNGVLPLLYVTLFVSCSYDL